MRLGHRGDFIRERKPSPKPYDDIDDMSFVESKRNGKPATWHNGYWYIQKEAPKTESWARRMNK